MVVSRAVVTHSLLLLLLCFSATALTVAFATYLFVGQLSKMYFVHLGNAIAITCMRSTSHLPVQFACTLVSWLGYALVRQFERDWLYIFLVGGMNVLEQLFGAALLHALLRGQTHYCSSLRFIGVVVVVAIAMSIFGAVPGSALICYVIVRQSYKRTVLTYFFSHITGNMTLYGLHILKESWTRPHWKFYIDLALSCGFTVVLHSFRVYNFGRTAALVASFPVLACVAVRNTQAHTVIAELCLLMIIFAFVIAGRGPYIIASQSLLELVMGLYTLVLASSLMSSLLSVVMEQRRAALKRVVDLKNKLFVMSSQISHDVRAPLMNIMTVCSSIQEGTASKDDIEQAACACEFIADTMDCWMGSLQSSGSGTAVRMKVEHLHSLCGRIGAHGRRACRDTRLQFVMERPPEDKLVLVDRRLLLQVLVNLISNAVKYTEQGSVHVHVEHQEGRLVVKVKDTGCGISADHLPKIFDQFFRVSTADKPSVFNKHSVANYGVGLMIVRNLVQQMQGTVTVESELGTGSVFTVRIPAEELQGEILLPTVPLEALSICVAEDNKIIQKQVRRMLGGCVLVTVVDNGVQALEALASEHYDVLCLDDEMPLMNGRELLVKARDLYPELGVVDISGGTALAPGLVRCCKPFSGTELCAAVVEAAAQSCCPV